MPLTPLSLKDNFHFSYSSFHNFLKNDVSAKSRLSFGETTRGQIHRNFALEKTTCLTHQERTKLC